MSHRTLQFTLSNNIEQELMRLQRDNAEKDEEIAQMKVKLKELEKASKQNRGTRTKRVKASERSKEEEALMMKGKKYALTIHLWLPDLKLEYNANSADPEQNLIREYIAALPLREKENFQVGKTARMVCGIIYLCEQ
jgi:hypothetical protein